MTFSGLTMTFSGQNYPQVIHNLYSIIFIECVSTKSHTSKTEGSFDLLRIC